MIFKNGLISLIKILMQLKMEILGTKKTKPNKQ